MSPKAKAKELICKFQDLDIEVGGQYDGYITLHNQDAKQCALIAVENLIQLFLRLCGNRREYYTSDEASVFNEILEVKQELNNL